MKYISLSIPGSGGTPVQLDSDLVPTGGLETAGQDLLGLGISLVLIAAIFFSLVSALRGGIDIISSEGNKERFNMGRERMRYAIVGLVVVFMSFFAVNFIGKFIGVNLLSFWIFK